MTEQIDAPLRTARAVATPAPVGVPVDPRLDAATLRAERERGRRARAAYEAKLSRLRLYSYCLTLTSCVLALMSFMYLAQGAADGDATFVWLGVAFLSATVVMLWSAIRITHVGEFATT
ncbi:MAG TPA: hypothetical protein VMZ00_11950 [Sporichthya sp.]|nr:hypothetical protein [Sporichthya sp.]